MIRGGSGISYNRIPEIVFANTRGNPPFFARYQICCGTSSADFGTPFADGQILYTLGASSSPLAIRQIPRLQSVSIPPQVRRRIARLKFTERLPIPQSHTSILIHSRGSMHCRTT